MKINIPLDSVKKQIREEFRIAPLVTPEMREAEDLWMQIWTGTPPWANDQDRTINFAKAVTGEAARLATMGVSVELSGSARADWLQERLNEELIPFLRDMVDVGCAAGMFLLKPTPDSIGLYTPPEFTITAVDNRKRVIGVVLYDTKATPDYYYVKDKAIPGGLRPSGIFCYTCKYVRNIVDIRVYTCYNITILSDWRA